MYRFFPPGRSFKKRRASQHNSTPVSTFERLECRTFLSASVPGVVAVNHDPTAAISAAPRAGSLPLTVRLDGRRSSDPDGDSLTYHWQFGDGQEATGPVVTHVYQDPGKFTAVLTVLDGHGGKDTAEVLVEPGHNLPEAQISLPTEGSIYSGGSTINFVGRASDPEGGLIDSSRFTWTIRSLGQRTRVLRTIRGVKSGRFNIPANHDADPGQGFRITLTARGSDGFVAKTHVDIRPRTVQLSLASTVPGLHVHFVDGSTSGQSVVGMKRTVVAPKIQTVDGVTYQFVGWSDGGRRIHDITVPQADMTYTAIYRLVSASSGG